MAVGAENAATLRRRGAYRRLEAEALAALDRRVAALHRRMEAEAEASLVRRAEMEMRLSQARQRTLLAQNNTRHAEAAYRAASDAAANATARAWIPGRGELAPTSFFSWRGVAPMSFSWEDIIANPAAFDAIRFDAACRASNDASDTQEAAIQAAHETEAGLDRLRIDMDRLWGAQA
ncbi:hypothetical protein M885DRAFT_565095 [Pelagophyceae sp. CCMP2097]|nr:hypothetical protein M885DRAFT_565095 [Pelagophyceae sp. CCMP2097]